jgi:hypothetical protein
VPNLTNIPLVVVVHYTTIPIATPDRWEPETTDLSHNRNRRQRIILSTVTLLMRDQYYFEIFNVSHLILHTLTQRLLIIAISQYLLRLGLLFLCCQNPSQSGPGSAVKYLCILLQGSYLLTILKIFIRGQFSYPKLRRYIQQCFNRLQSGNGFEITHH